MSILSAKKHLFGGAKQVMPLTWLAGKCVAVHTQSVPALLELNVKISQHVVPHLASSQFCAFVEAHQGVIFLEDLFSRHQQQEVVARLLEEVNLRSRIVPTFDMAPPSLNNPVILSLQSMLGTFMADISMSVDVERDYLEDMGVSHLFWGLSVPQIPKVLARASLNPQFYNFAWCPPPTFPGLLYPLGSLSTMAHVAQHEGAGKNANPRLFYDLKGQNKMFLFMHRAIDAGNRDRHCDVIGYALSAFDCAPKMWTLELLCQLAASTAALKMHLNLSLTLLDHALAKISHRFHFQRVALALQQVFWHSGLFREEKFILQAYPSPLVHSYVHTRRVLVHCHATVENVENVLAQRWIVATWHSDCNHPQINMENAEIKCLSLLEDLRDILDQHQSSLCLHALHFFRGMLEYLTGCHLALLETGNSRLAPHILPHWIAANKAFTYCDSNRVLNNMINLEVPIMKAFTQLTSSFLPRGEISLELSRSINQSDAESKSRIRMVHSRIHIRNYFRMVLFGHMFGHLNQEWLDLMGENLLLSMRIFEGEDEGYRQTLATLMVKACVRESRHQPEEEAEGTQDEDFLDGKSDCETKASSFAEEEVKRFMVNLNNSQIRRPGSSFHCTFPTRPKCTRAIQFVELDSHRMKDAILFCYEDNLRFKGY